MAKKTFDVSHNGKLLRWACFVFPAFFASGAIYADNIDNQDYVLSGAMDFIAESGVTNVYAGRITGTGPVVIKGGGTVAFSNPENDYTGGTIVSNAVFRLDADGCAGSGAITGAVDTAHVYMNCANVPNDIYFCQNYTSDSAAQTPTDYPNANSHPLYPLAESVLVSGNIFSLGSGQFCYTAGTSVSGFANRTVSFTGDFRAVNNGRIEVAAYGTTIFKGLYSSEYKNRMYLGKNYSAKGIIEFHCASNRINAASLSNADIYLKATDALPHTLLVYQNGDANYGRIFLCGNDQSFRGICWESPTPDELAAGQCWLSEERPSTVRITGCESNTIVKVGGSPKYVNRLALFGNITLVMDVDPAYTASGFFQEFSVRKSTTAGDLIISNGDFRVSGTASFPNVPNIYVGSGGKFVNASTKTGAFAGCRNLTVLGKMDCIGDDTPFAHRTVALTLGGHAEFSLPAETTMTVRSLVVGEESMPDGTYGDGGTPVAQIRQGTIIVQSGNFYVDCQRGYDSNDGSAKRPFKTIRAATSAALSGDIIHVAPGLYGVAEGTQTATSKIEARVVVPENVTIESTDGATETFIVGAVATGDQIDNAEYGTGTNAVRCVYAKRGAVLRGFTLTGGRGVGTGEYSNNGLGAAFMSDTALAATLEDCIVSNNVSYRGPICQAVVKRCRVFENISTRTDNVGGSAGYLCSWYNCIIDRNRGHGTVHAASAFENCTIGANNVDPFGGVPQVLYWYGGGDHAVINSVILGGRYFMMAGAVINCTNCLIVEANGNVNDIMKERAYNTVITNLAAAKVDNDFRPVLGEFVGIDKGDVAFSSDALGSVDINGMPRILNGAIDIGAVEYDWRPAFAAEIGKRFKLTYASPTVSTNATGGVKLDGDVGVFGERALPVCVAGMVSTPGPYAFTFELTGGSVAVYVSGELVGESSGYGNRLIRFNVPNAAADIRFVFTPDAENPGVAILHRFAGARGFSINIR